MRTTIFLTALCLSLFSCGTPCSHIAGAEQQADQKGKDCGTQSGAWTDAQIKSCEAGLTKCSQDDQKAMETYADCLTKLPTCASGQSFTWALERAGCLQGFQGMSANCWSAIH